ncbi:MAG: DegV family protein [Peptococcaceae bacterium]|nr:DegV family protein [Peptococcaceae bacterium]
MIKITADSTCDLPAWILDSYNITIMPLNVLVGDKAFQDGVNITPGELFRFVEQDGKTCKTAAVNTYNYLKKFEELSSQYKAVIHISLSSFLSSSYQNAVLASQNFSNVYVIDSRNLSSGSGHLVYDAALMAKEGLDPKDICKKLEETVSKIEASFVIKSLDYLHKGGRCSSITVLGANILNLKPCIEVTDGKMTVGKKYRGNFEHCIENYVKDRLEGRTDIDYSRVFITHPMCPEEVVNRAKETILKYANFDEIIETRAGCTISCHCGPNTLGILFKRK